MEIVVLYFPNVLGMLLSRKFVAMLGGSLDLDLTYINVPINNGKISRVPNVPMNKIHVQEIGDDIETNETHEPIKESLPGFSPVDIPFAIEEDFDHI
jgi:hypothetical protein